jgi:GNAT superfamily N-acetyltransferase
MGHADFSTMPAKDSLSPRALSMTCFQVVNDYKAMAEGRPTDQPSYLHRGIGTMLLQKTIEWARVEGWDEIRDQAIPHIPPLMTWHCHLSVERYRKFGFEITRSAETLDGPVSQRQGYHGEAMKRMWEPFAHMSDEEVSMLYDVVLRIN